MTAQRISDRRMVVRGTMIALFCGCWLLANLSAGQETEPRRRKAPPTAPPRRVQKSTKQAEQTTLRVHQLKYANAASLAELLLLAMTDAKQTRIMPDERLNAILVSAFPEQHDKVADLINELDVPPARDVDHELRVFRLRYADPEEASAVISRLFGSDDARIAVDQKTNSVLVQAQGETLARIEAIFEKLDIPADKDPTRYDPGTTFRVRVVWLATIDADGPPDDLKEVVGLLSKVGVKGLRQVGQVIVNTTPDGRFQVGCSPILNQRPSDLEISGEFDQQQETPTLKIELSASQVEVPPATTDAPDRRRLPERKTLVDLQTVIAAPLEHYVVLGVAPVEKITSVFIVQVTVSN